VRCGNWNWRPVDSNSIPMRVPARLSVLHIGLETPEHRPSGLNRYLSELVVALNGEGVANRVIAVGDAPAQCSPDYVLATSPTAWLPIRLVKLWKLSMQLTPDVLDAHFALYALGPVLNASLHRIPVVVHFHGPWAEESRSARPDVHTRTRRAVEKAVYRRASACVVLSKAFGDLLHECYGVPKWAITCIPPGVDFEVFRPGQRDAARTALAIDPDRWVCLVVRRLVPRMGIDVLLDAWSRVVQQSNRACELLIVGEGPEQPRLRAEVRARGLDEAVRFLGRLDEDSLTLAYQAADVSVIPSVELEGFGLVVLESLACGTPVIGSDTGGLPEVLSPLQADLVVPAGDVSALGDRLLAAHDHRSPLPSARQSRKYAERFDWAAVSRRHLDLYTSQLRSGVKTRNERAGDLRDRKIRVVVLGHTATLSGGELAMSRLIPAMEHTDVHVILAEHGPLVAYLRERGISVEVSEMGKRGRLLRKDMLDAIPTVAVPALIAGVYVAKLAHRLRQLRPDVVHTNTLKAALYGGAAAQIASLPCVWHLRDRIETDYLPRPAVSMVRRCGRILPNQVIANSRTTLSTLGLPAGRGRVIPSPIDVRKLDRSHPPTPLRIGMVGRIAPWKGQDIFLKAFAQCFPDGDERCVIVGAPLFGEEEYAHTIHEIAHELGIESRVEFRGFQVDIANELASLDILVHASIIPEPFGQAVVEGMAAGLPVVAANAGGPAEVISQGHDGLCYEPGNIAELAVTLGELARSPERRRELGVHGEQTAARYRAPVIAEAVEKVYRDVLAGE